MNDPLDRLLREDAVRALADDGFSARVMHALPAPGAASFSWFRPVLTLGSLALGCALALWLSPAGASLLDGFKELVQLRLGSAAAVSGLAISAVLLASALVVALDTD